MVATVLIFAMLTAAFEMFLLLKFVPLSKLMSPWTAAFVHIGVFFINIIVHWGTIVGTMTAITAALVSFAVYPACKWIKAFRNKLQEPYVNT